MTVKTYLATVLDGMAKGLFASLIIGVIIKQIGIITGITELANIGQAAQYCMGPCIGAGIAYARNSKQFTILSAIVAGAIGAGMMKYTPNGWNIGIGEPAGAFIAAVCGLELGRLVEGKTKFDLLIVPAVVISTGAMVGLFISPVISSALNQIGLFVNELTRLQPIPMGILLGIVVGMILTLPISSAAICIAINIGGADGASIAAGAALAGCCAQMVGFAAISFRENKFGGIISQGLGTSMLQVPNIIKNPWIWLPPTVASGVCGLLAANFFKMTTTSVGAGMGTSGLVGQFTTYESMGVTSLVPMILLHVVIPVVVSVPISEIMRKKGIIKFGDLSL